MDVSGRGHSECDWVVERDFFPHLMCSATRWGGLGGVDVKAGLVSASARGAA